MSTTCNHLQLELFITGELDAAEKLSVEQHLTSCEECTSYVAKLTTDREMFLAQHPFSSFTRAHAPLKQLPWYSGFASKLFRPAFIPVAAGLLLSLTLLPVVLRTVQSDRELVRFKGTNSIRYIYKDGGTVHQGAPDDRFSEGDRIQVLYSSAKKQYFALVSIDAAGSVSFYHPKSDNDTCTIAVTPGEVHTYPTGIEFDATPGHELLCGLFSEKPLETAAVENWLQTAFSSQKNLSLLSIALKKKQDEVHADFQGLLVTKE